MEKLNKCSSKKAPENEKRWKGLLSVWRGFGGLFAAKGGGQKAAKEIPTQREKGHKICTREKPEQRSGLSPWIPVERRSRGKKSRLDFRRDETKPSPKKTRRNTITKRNPKVALACFKKVKFQGSIWGQRRRSKTHLPSTIYGKKDTRATWKPSQGIISSHSLEWGEKRQQK